MQNYMDTHLNDRVVTVADDDCLIHVDVRLDRLIPVEIFDVPLVANELASGARLGLGVGHLLGRLWHLARVAS